MKDLSRAAPATDRYRRRGRPSPYSWSAAAPLLALPGLVILLLAFGLAWGGNDALRCDSAPIPRGFQHEPYARGERTLWPLGANCVFGADTPTSVTIHEDNWAPTIVALTGAAIITTSITATARTYRPRPS